MIFEIDYHMILSVKKGSFLFQVRVRWGERKGEKRFKSERGEVEIEG